jgi:hypothetical protein
MVQLVLQVLKVHKVLLEVEVKKVLQAQQALQVF